ncbi:glutaminase A, partial [Mycolicibacterium sphagni]|nr:glutaminase A [Mycolicibacterium sphagni]MCV7180300.1 glutaminase A [Mycolicibacterium sphagni]
MTVIAQNWLAPLVDEVRPHLAGGAVSTYLPELRR